MLDGRLAQLVRASALQAEGHKFESCIVHHAGVAQLVRASACHAEGRAFKSRHSRHLAFRFMYNIHASHYDTRVVLFGFSPLAYTC